MGENKKIVKNSIILYGRLLITTVIGLYTSRIILNELGASDYGLYSVIGGIVVMLNFLNTTMLAVSFRYLAIEIGKGEKGNPNKIFNISLIIHIALALLLILIAESVGIYYINNYLNIKPEKISDAIFVLHFSVLSTIVTVISIPFQGVVNANEKFIVNATVSVLQSLLRLITAILLIYYLGNKLRYYSILMFIVMLFPSILYIIYCYKKNPTIVKWRLIKNKADYFGMFKYTSWIAIGAIASIGTRQGFAIIINLFFGTVLNATYGIASQVYSYVMMFVKNLNQAAVPQITKSHSSGNHERSLQLVYSISKYAFFLMLLPSVPILLSINIILRLWLVKVPDYTDQFIILMIINGLIACTGSGFDAAIQATGKIKKTQIFFSIISLSTLPIAYLFYSLGFAPNTINLISIFATTLNLVVQARILKELTDFNINIYLKNTVLRSLLVSLTIIPQFFLRKLFSQDFSGIIIFTIISIVLTLITIFIIGLTNSERIIIQNQLIKLKIINRN